MVVGLIVEEILNVDVKCVKGTGAQNMGQGHRVKIPAKSVHIGEALCKVWWLEVLHLRICLFDLGLTSLSTFFSHIATVSGCGRELNAHF